MCRASRSRCAEGLFLMCRQGGFGYPQAKMGDLSRPSLPCFPYRCVRLGTLGTPKPACFCALCAIARMDAAHEAVERRLVIPGCALVPLAQPSVKFGLEHLDVPARKVSADALDGVRRKHAGAE